jgi:hypothetical protein
MLKLEKYSLGVGDRFAHQAKAQLRACMMAAERGVTVVPVWNKSHREHTTIGSQPESVRAAADAAVRDLGWTHPYHVDADHIRLGTVGGYLASSDFFTIDVADCIGRPAPDALIETFRKRHPELAGRIMIPYLDTPYEVSPAEMERIAGKYLLAVQEAGRIYRRIAEAKGADNVIAEVSMDETDSPQTPVELLVILAAIADEGIPIQTIAPKFTGRFNKGVDYVGDVRQFEREFQADLAVLAIAARQYGLPENLKLSVHSGSDKFSISEPIRRSLAKFDAGVHVKTAGTTWLEEIIGLAEADGEGLALAKEIYARAFEKREALCAPYAAVIDIDPAKLPPPSEVAGWGLERFASAVRHDRSNPEFNPSMRQLLHVGYKIAAQMGNRFLEMVEACEPTIAPNVTANLYERHIKPLFLDPAK